MLLLLASLLSAERDSPRLLVSESNPEFAKFLHLAARLASIEVQVNLDTDRPGFSDDDEISAHVRHSLRILCFLFELLGSEEVDWLEVIPTETLLKFREIGEAARTAVSDFLKEFPTQVSRLLIILSYGSFVPIMV